MKCAAGSDRVVDPRIGLFPNGVPVTRLPAVRQVAFPPPKGILVRTSESEHIAETGYTKSMKTAVSIPDSVFEGAERLARLTNKSRSQLFSDAVKEYVARHAPDDVTAAMDKVCEELGETRDPFVSLASRRMLERVEW